MTGIQPETWARHVEEVKDLGIDWCARHL
jgi:hypothetical protein